MQYKFSSSSWTGSEHENKLLSHCFQKPTYYLRIETRQAREHGVVEIFSKDQQTRRGYGEFSFVLPPCCQQIWSAKKMRVVPCTIDE